MNRRRFLSVLTAVIGMSATRDAARAADAAYWEGVVRDAAARHGVSPDWLASVCACESGFNPNAVGDPNIDGSGPDSGLMQFSPATWHEMTGYMGISADIWDGHAQAEVGAWAFSQGFACRWVCACPENYR